MPTTTNHPDPQSEREKFITAFNTTMIKIWQEQITLLDIIDTDRLPQSPVSVRVQTDGRFYECSLYQAFLEYGLWQDFGTGKEIPHKREQSQVYLNSAEREVFGNSQIPRGNPGDIGRDRKRQPRRWFSRKYYASVMNLRDFMADNIGQEFVGIVAKALDDKYRRYHH